jgi:hypothetical protein
MCRSISDGAALMSTFIDRPSTGVDTFVEIATLQNNISLSSIILRDNRSSKTT